MGAVAFEHFNGLGTCVLGPLLYHSKMGSIILPYQGKK
jgi:hypothetical protein